MKAWVNPESIYLYRHSVDFRKSINGLSAIIISECELDCMTGALFLFCNKARDKLKILYWDKTGFALWYKRLEKDKFKWPKACGNKTLPLNEAQLHHLLEGFDIVGHEPIEHLKFEL